MDTVPSRGRPTVYTVGQRAGVSVATVSRVISHPERVRAETRRRVHEAIAELDYVPHSAAASLARRRFNAHGLVLPELSGTYYSDLLMGYESVASAAGQSVLLLIVDDRPDIEVSLLRLAARVDGIVLMGGVEVSASAVRAVTHKIPVIGISGAVHDIENFVTQGSGSMTALTRHLVHDHGRRRLVFVGDPSLASDVQDRYDAFCSVVAELGEPTQPVLARYEESDGRAVAAAYLRGEIDADALVCANDELALGILDHLNRAGVDLPGALAVTGFDDVPSARLVRPALTTVAQPVRQLAAQTAVRMCELTEDAARGTHQPPADLADQHQLPTTVVLRQSCGCTTDPTPDPAPSAEPHPEEL